MLLLNYPWNLICDSADFHKRHCNRLFHCRSIQSSSWVERTKGRSPTMKAISNIVKTSHYKEGLLRVSFVFLNFTKAGWMVNIQQNVQEHD